ncbi:O-antigen ligase family protein [Priestia megaterium]|uniref:O-antigen polymerase n=1 Tax=Priestia megaterium (strain WSH-002) TaxID=1006007 RepID=A0A8D3X4Q3_PRIMW|nr:O-antigen ligase family protein [Priestia megaterium]AEN91004.1 Putative O-antigen polymerase [Priestia megaterium WSH-002]UOO40441.1 O-antigen ligase family protein [Priestia megaterium]
MNSILKLNKFLIFTFILGLFSIIGVTSAVQPNLALLFMAAFIGFIFFVFLLKNPIKLLLIATVFLPFTSVISIVVLGAKLSIPDALVLFLGLILLVRGLFKTNKFSLTREHKRVIISYVSLLIFSLLFSILCFYKVKGNSIMLPSWTNSYNSVLIGSIVANFRLIVPLILLVAVPLLVKNETDLHTILKHFIVGSFVSTCYGIYEFAVKTAGLGFSYLLPGHAQGILFFGDGKVRLSGTFGEPSYFAGFIVLSIFICVYAKKLRVLPNLVLNIMVLLHLIVLLFTYSTGGYLALLVGTLVYLFYSGKVKFFVSVYFLALLAIMLVLFVPTVSEVVQKPFDTSTGQRGSSTDRSNTAKAAINMFKDSPVYGIGYGNFGFLYNDYRPETAIYKTTPSIANNVYADFISSYGLIGLSLLLVIFVQFKRSLKKIRIHSRTEYPFFIGAVFSILVVYMAYPTFSYAFQWIFYSILLIRPNLLKNPTN